jgi:hypothetical protein
MNLSKSCICAFFLVFFLGCVTQPPTPPSNVSNIPNVSVIIKYACPDGSIVLDQSQCPSAAPPSNISEEKPTQNETINETKGCKTTDECPPGYYCESGECIQMLPASFLVSPPVAYYSYSLSASFTGSFNISNCGKTPIEVTLVPNSEHIEILSDKTILIFPGQPATVKYGLSLNKTLPTGTTSLYVFTSSPVNGTGAARYEIVVTRRY